MKSKVMVGMAVLIMVAFAAVAAQAAENDELQPGVARVSLIHGDVSMQRGDSGDWVAAAINAPVVAGDHVLTGTRSRTEVQLDYANVLRLDESTEAKLADLTRTRDQVQVRRGTLNYTVFKGSEADVEIDTPNVAIRPLREGSYRVEVISEEETRAIVRNGEAEVTTPQGSTRVHKGDMITVRGHDNPEYQVANAPRKDAWDNWNKQRDDQIWDAASWRYANRYYTGAGDLDGYGHWVYVPGYDQCWVPAVAVGWAPYRYGRWVWEPFYGWTWVSYEPWGWAPYHYGRWFMHGGRWAWWPGPVYGGFRPVWAPAYVSFFGFGHHVGVSVGFGFGSIGWLPIGPSDFFHPWWGRHGRTVNIVNITNITNIRNITNVNGVAPLGGTRPPMSNLRGVLDNPRLQHAVTSMPSEQFGRGPVPRERRILNTAELRQGQLMAGAVPVVPTRASLQVVDRRVDPATLPGRAQQPERYFTRSQPTFRPQPFHAEQAQVQEALRPRQAEAPANRPGATPAVREPMANNPMRSPAAAAERPAMPSGNRAGGLAEPRSPASAGDSNAMNRGWRRFGGDVAEMRDAQTNARQQSQDQNRTAERQQPQDQGRAAQREQPREQRGAPAAPNTSGWRRFSDRQPGRDVQGAPARRAMPPETRGTPRSDTATAPRQQAAPAANPSERPGWQGFRRQPESAAPESMRRSMDSSGAGRPYTPGGQGAAQREQPRSWQRSAEAPRSASRPPLRVERPIVTPRASAPRQGGRGGGENRGGSHPPQRNSPPRVRQ